MEIIWKKVPWGSILRPTEQGVEKGLKSNDLALFVGFQDSMIGGYVKVLRFGRQTAQPYAAHLWQIFREQHLEDIKQ